MQEQVENTQKGIRLEATFGQFVNYVFMVLIMLVLPIAGYNYLQQNYIDTNEKVYTVSSLESQGRQVDGGGRVAGVSTSDDKDILDQISSVVGFVVDSKSIMIVVGVVFISLALIMIAAMLYDFAKK